MATSIQRQALNALIFLYRHVLEKPIEDKIAPVKAKKRRRPPAVLTKNDVRQVLNQMRGPHLLMAKMILGGGLRLMGCLRLRIMDLDFAHARVYVRGKGDKNRLTILPPSINKDIQSVRSPLETLRKIP